MRPGVPQQISGRGPLGRQAGEAIDHLRADDPCAYLHDPPFDPYDLLHARPGEVGIQRGGPAQAAAFDSTMRLVERLGLGEDGLDGGALNTVAMSCSNWGWLPFATIR